MHFNRLVHVAHMLVHLVQMWVKLHGSCTGSLRRIALRCFAVAVRYGTVLRSAVLLCLASHILFMFALLLSLIGFRRP